MKLTPKMLAGLTLALGGVVLSISKDGRKGSITFDLDTPDEIPQPKGTTRKWGAGSLKNMQGLDPRLIAILNRALALSPFDFSITSGKRTQSEQDRLVASGASWTRNSDHVTGLAIDFKPVGADWSDVAKFKACYPAFEEAAEELGETVKCGIPSRGDWAHISLIDRNPENRVIVNPGPAWRRAKSGEVTPEMYQSAVKFLNSGGLLGETLTYPDFLLAAETHYNEDKGNHKGISVFVRA